MDERRIEGEWEGMGAEWSSPIRQGMVTGTYGKVTASA